MKKSNNGLKKKTLPIREPLKRYVQVSAGPSLGGSGVKVKLRELFSTTEKVVTFSEFKRLEHNGQIETPAFIPKEKR